MAVPRGPWSAVIVPSLILGVLALTASGWLLLAPVVVFFATAVSGPRWVPYGLLYGVSLPLAGGRWSSWRMNDHRGPGWGRRLARCSARWARSDFSSLLIPLGTLPPRLHVWRRC